ncbi:MAG TPA: hypothetical protein VGE98_13430 [Thermoanaerobaculia bacterium]
MRDGENTAADPEVDRSGDAGETGQRDGDDSPDRRGDRDYDDSEPAPPSGPLPFSDGGLPGWEDGDPPLRKGDQDL